MKAGPKFFFWLLLILITLVSGYKFKQFFLDQDYTLLVNLDCNPSEAGCFIMDCSPEEDSECDTTPYKKLEMWAGNAPNCLLQRECLDFTCTSDDETCFITYCEDETRETWEVCSELVIQEPNDSEQPEEEISEIIQSSTSTQ